MLHQHIHTWSIRGAAVLPSRGASSLLQPRRKPPKRWHWSRGRRRRLRSCLLPVDHTVRQSSEYAARKFPVFGGKDERGSVLTVEHQQKHTPTGPVLRTSVRSCAQLDSLSSNLHDGFRYDLNTKCREYTSTHQPSVLSSATTCHRPLPSSIATPTMAVRWCVQESRGTGWQVSALLAVDFQDKDL